jgi:isopentenyldiphosphate isomerase
MLADYRQAVDREPGFSLWLQERTAGEGPLLLVARWLCHLAGLRHRTVQLFLDHPATEGYTLLQVRGFDKAEAPGCFDVPCAGHVAGLETVEEALSHELREELGLERGDVPSPQALGCYEYRDLAEGSPLWNVEFRAVYRGRLAAGALAKMRFVDREVAAVALFAASEVGRLIEAAPERVASGLAGSWGMYR